MNLHTSILSSAVSLSPVRIPNVLGWIWVGDVSDEGSEDFQSGFSTDVLPQIGTFVAAVDGRYFVTNWK